MMTIIFSFLVLVLVGSAAGFSVLPPSSSPLVCRTRACRRREKAIHCCRSSRHADHDAEQSSAASSRRRFISRAVGISSISLGASAAHADPSIISSLQGPFQDAIAPGHWIGQFVGINSKTVEWEFETVTPAQVSSAMVDVFNQLSTERKEKLYMPNFNIVAAEPTRVHVQTWTKNEWLDSFDLALSEQPQQSSDGKTITVAKASFYATGFLPTSIPGAPLFNIAVFFFPFASPGPRGEMLQDFRLRALEGLLRKKINEQQTPRMTGL